MEQPLDFSKATSASNFIKAPPASVTVKKQLQRMKLKNRKESSFHLNSENSDEGTSRSSASSPDSVNNDLEQLGNLQSLTGQSSLTDKNLMMLINQTFNSQIKAGVPNVFRNLGDPHTPFLPNLYAANMLSMAKQTATQQLNSQISNQINSQFTNQLNNQINSQLACQLNNQISNQYNHLNQIGQMSDQLSQTNLQKKSKSSKSKSNGSNLKPVSRKSMILAKQEQEQNKLPIVNANFGILSNSQNSNILQDIDKESNCSGSMILNTSQMSIHSNLSGEENNGLFDDVGSLDGESPNSARRRRGQPIPEAMKDDSYWVSDRVHRTRNQISKLSLKPKPKFPNLNSRTNQIAFRHR